MIANQLQRWTTAASLRVARETFSNARTGAPDLYYKRISRKLPIKMQDFQHWLCPWECPMQSEWLAVRWHKTSHGMDWQCLQLAGYKGLSVAVRLISVGCRAVGLWLIPTRLPRRMHALHSSCLLAIVFLQRMGCRC